MKKSLTMKLNYIFNRLFPLKKNTIFFQSFAGQYNDNPKYISEYIHEHYPQYTLVWGIDSEKSNIDDIPTYLKVVKMYSKEYYKYSTRSKVIVENMNGIVGFISEKESKIISKIFKRKNQLNVSTWHGIPLKHIGLDEIKSLKNNIDYIFTSSNYISSGSEYSYEIFKKAFYPISIKNYGSPRNDILFEKDEKKLEKLKKKLNIPINKKVILYAPTFRKDPKESGIIQLNQININKLLEELRIKFGGEWCFVFRAHHMVLKEIMKERINQDIILGFNHDDMNEYMAITDFLITDYSGCMFDYMLTQRPCILYTNDKEEYIKNNRKLYFDMKELPYNCACNEKELFELIRNYKPNNEVNKFLKKIGNKEIGIASKIIADDINDFIMRKNCYAK